MRTRLLPDWWKLHSRLIAAFHQRFAHAILDTAETRDPLFDCFSDKIFVGNQALTIASWFSEGELLNIEFDTPHYLKAPIPRVRAADSPGYPTTERLEIECAQPSKSNRTHDSGSSCQAITSLVNRVRAGERPIGGTDGFLDVL